MKKRKGIQKWRSNRSKMATMKDIIVSMKDLDGLLISRCQQLEKRTEILQEFIKNLYYSIKNDIPLHIDETNLWAMQFLQTELGLHFEMVYGRDYIEIKKPEPEIKRRHFIDGEIITETLKPWNCY